MTKIEWCDETINPIVGCSKISEGCRHCYAEKMAWRLKCMGIPKYQDIVDRNGWTGEIGIDMSVFDRLPKRPRKIFIGSMGDLFHENVSWCQIADIFDIMMDNNTVNPHTYMLLTKRPDRLDFFITEYFKGNPFWKQDLENIWLGVTVEHPDYLWRIEELLKTPAAVRFISIEPMLEPVDLWDKVIPAMVHGVDVDPLDWVIVGCETGPRRRITKLKWIEDLVIQCSDVGIPVFVKQAEIDGKIVKMPKILGKAWVRFPKQLNIN